MKVPGVNRLVVLVDEDDDLLPVVPVEIGRQIEEGAPAQRCFVGTIEDLPVASDLDVVEGAAVEQVAVLVVKIGDLLADRPPALLEGLCLGAFEVEIQDRIALEMGPVRVACLPDRQILEQMREILVALLEPAAEHGQVQRLAEATGTRKDDRLDAWPIEELADQVGLVDVLELLLAQGAEIVEANGDTQRHGDTWTRRQATRGPPGRQGRTSRRPTPTQRPRPGASCF